jgi:hypothetical protein
VEVVRHPAFVVLALVAGMAAAATGVLVGVREEPARAARAYVDAPPSVAGAVFRLRCPHGIPRSALRHTPRECRAQLRVFDRR